MKHTWLVGILAGVAARRRSDAGAAQQQSRRRVPNEVATVRHVTPPGGDR